MAGESVAFARVRPNADAATARRFRRESADGVRRSRPPASVVRTFMKGMITLAPRRRPYSTSRSGPGGLSRSEIRAEIGTSCMPGDCCSIRARLIWMHRRSRDRPSARTARRRKRGSETSRSYGFADVGVGNRNAGRERTGVGGDVGRSSWFDESARAGYSEAGGAHDPRFWSTSSYSSWRPASAIPSIGSLIATAREHDYRIMTRDRQSSTTPTQGHVRTIRLLEQQPQEYP